MEQPVKKTLTEQIEEALGPLPADDPYVQAVRRLENEDDFPTRPDTASERPTDPAPPPAFDSEPPPKLRGAHWLDWGKDTGPRLRVRGLVDEKDTLKTIHPEPACDPKLVDEVHAESERAFREGDDHTLAKLYEDVLDDIHSSENGDPAERAMVRAADELIAAMTAELREVARSERNWGWQFALTELGFRIRAKTPQGETFECRIVQRETRDLIMLATTDVRAAAARAVGKAREEIHKARARVLIGGYVPTENETARA